MRGDVAAGLNPERPRNLMLPDTNEKTGKQQKNSKKKRKRDKKTEQEEQHEAKVPKSQGAAKKQAETTKTWSVDDNSPS